MFPRTFDIPEEQITPIPIETVFFLEDGRQDQSQLNRFYFDYPGNWATANNGENIIGLRSIKLQRSYIKLDFIIKIIKYTEDEYNMYTQGNYNDTINDLVQKSENINKVDLNVVCWIKPNDYSYDNFFETVNETMINYIKKGWANGFVQDTILPIDRDIQLDGYYDKNGYHIKIYSERNTNDLEDYKISFNIFYANENFKELFHFKNSHQWQPEIIFDKVWDLKRCNVFSSFAEQSLHHYIGTTDTEYPEIKYYKLNSSDQQFWIEFCSMGHNRIPSYFPKSVSFAIEIQFHSFNKRLNI